MTALAQFEQLTGLKFQGGGGGGGGDYSELGKLEMLRRRQQQAQGPGRLGLGGHGPQEEDPDDLDRTYIGQPLLEFYWVSGDGRPMHTLLSPSQPVEILRNTLFADRTRWHCTQLRPGSSCPLSALRDFL